jgi:hypothetical protein
MSAQPREGDTKKCGNCGHLMMLFSRFALVQITIKITPEATIQEETYGPAWLCSHCGAFEQISN